MVIFTARQNANLNEVKMNLIVKNLAGKSYTRIQLECNSNVVGIF